MSHADGKVLVLGALAGAAGVSLAVACYQGFRARRRASCYLSGDRRSDFLLVDGPGVSGVPGVAGSQAPVLQRLEALIQAVSELKDEMKSLKSALPALHRQVRDELREPDQGGRHRVSPVHRTTPTRRKRVAAAAAGGHGAGGRSSEEAESEGGYMTALTDSDEDEQSDEERPADQLMDFVQRIDRLHRGADDDKRESLNLMLQHRDQFGQNSEFLWRLIRAYVDAHDVSSSLEEKKKNAEAGRKVGEEAVTFNPMCAESHQWFAIMCGIMAEYDTVQNKIKNGYIFKDHLDKAIELNPQDPMSYYLLGRWCYAVAQLSWIERKVAATLFGEPPSATVEDALKNFIKVEEIQPGYSKVNYVFLAKCYRDLGQRDEARAMCGVASSMNSVSKEDEEAQKELATLGPALGL